MRKRQSRPNPSSTPTGIRQRRSLLLGVLPAAVAAAALVAACGSSSAPSAPAATSSPSIAAAAAGKPVIHIKGFMYSAPTSAVHAGESFTVVNDDSVAHTFEDVNGAFDSHTIGAGKTVTVVAPKAGSYSVKCDFHTSMHDTLVVS